MACVSTFPGLDKSALAEDFSSRWWFLKDYEKKIKILIGYWSKEIAAD